VGRPATSGPSKPTRPGAAGAGHGSLSPAVRAALPKAARWTIDTSVAPFDGSLILFDAEDERLLVFGSSSTEGLSRQVHDLTALVKAQAQEIKALRGRIRDLEEAR